MSIEQPPPTPTPENRLLPSRSTGACNACRTRKQKCDGEKPSCVRCRQLTLECVWPERLKRGPAKGYTEALEARLAETEEVLFKALSCIPEGGFGTVFEGVGGGVGGREEGERTSAVDRKDSVERWCRGPLRTMGGVERWFEERKGELEGRGGRDERGGGGMALGLPEQADSYRGEEEHRKQSFTQHAPSGSLEVLGHGNGNYQAQKAGTSSMAEKGLGLSREFQDEFVW